MADSILRLRIESNDFDNKIQRASKSLQSFMDQVSKSGDSFASLDKESVEAIKAIGKMDTVATTSKKKLAELTNAFTELSLQYKKLSDAEKQSEPGKALAASLDKLKTRITEAKSQLEDVNKELGNTSKESGSAGGALDALSAKFGVNIKQLAGWGAALAAGNAALDVAKDVFFKNEEQLDEWGRVVASSQSLYSGFLSTLNTGDISGFLSRIDDIIRAARDAYDALDELDTFNAFNQVNVEKTRTGMTEAIVDYREGNGSKDSVRAAGDAYKKELEERRKLERQAYLDAVKQKAQETGVSYQDLLDAMNGSYGNYKDLKNVQPTGTRITTSFQGVGMAPLVQQESYATTRQEKLGEALRQFNDTELKSLQALGAQAERTGNEIAQVDRQLVRVLNGRQGGGGGKGGSTTPKSDVVAAPEGSVADLTKQMQELQKAQQLVTSPKAWNKYQSQIDAVASKIDTIKGKTDLDKMFEAGDMPTGPAHTIGEEMIASIQQGMADAMQNADITTLRTLLEVQLKNGIEGVNIDPNAILQKILDEGADIPDEYWQNLQDQINEKLAELNIAPIQIDFSTGNVKDITKDAKAMSKEWKAAASAIASVGDAMSGIDDPAAKVMGTIAQAVASIALGYATATVQASEMGPWAWIGFAAAGLATMISTISAIHSATGYADGGIIPGNRFSGDNQWARVNAGELILNQAQTGIIASALQGGGSEGMAMQPYVEGEKVFLGMENWSKRSGRGEIVTTGMLRRMGLM